MDRAFVAVLGLALFTVPACGGADRDGSGAIDSAGDVSVFALRVGDCYDDHDDGEVADVAAVPCDQPHDNEVIALFDLPEGPWPGEDEVRAQGRAGCLERFEAAIGTAYEASDLEVYPITPSRSTWGEQDDREIVCAAYHMEFEKLTGSVLGSGR